MHVSVLLCQAEYADKKGAILTAPASAHTEVNVIIWSVWLLIGLGAQTTMHVLYVKTDRGNIVQSKNLVADSICIIIRQIDSVCNIGNQKQHRLSKPKHKCSRQL